MDDPNEQADELALRFLDGDDSVVGDLVRTYGIVVERSISKRFPNLSNDAEDIVAEALKRLWRSREHYDGSRSIRAYFYSIAYNVACELSAGHLAWQKSRMNETHLSVEHWSKLGFTRGCHDASDVNEESALSKAVKESMATLTPVQRDVLMAFAFADGFPVNTTELGKELGIEHYNGTPIPSATIRQHKARSKAKLESEMRKRGFDLSKAGAGR